MPINSKYLFVVSMDVDPDKNKLFNEVYDTEHIPNLRSRPSARSEPDGNSRCHGVAIRHFSCSVRSTIV